MPFVSSMLRETDPGLSLLKWPASNTFMPASFVLAPLTHLPLSTYSPEVSGASPNIDVASITYSQSSVYPGNSAATNATMTNGSANETQATATGNSGPQFVRMDLGGTFIVAKVFIGTPTASLAGGWSSTAFYTNGRTLQYTTDGINWTTERTISGLSGGTVTELSVSFTASAIRVAITDDWIVVTEFYATST